VPVQHHPDVELTAGVPWTIAGQLCNAKGQAFDVTNAQLTWVLLNADSWVVPMTVSITKTDPVNGAISIEVAKTDAALAPGRYTDAIQIRQGTGTGLYWIGNILVAADPPHTNASEH
jgi:hypothetical protein